MGLDIQIPYTAPSYQFAGLQSLGAGLGDFIQQQRQKAAQNEFEQYQDQQNQIIVNHAATLKRPDGSPYLTPDVYHQFQTATTPKARDAIAKGIAANMATDFAMQRQQLQTPGLQVLQPPPGAPTGTKPQVVLTGADVHNLTPPVPTVGVAQPAEGSPPGTPSQAYFQAGNQSYPITPADAKRNPNLPTPNAVFDAIYPNPKTDPNVMAAVTARLDATKNFNQTAGVLGFNADQIDNIIKNPQSLKYYPSGPQIADKTTGKFVPIQVPTTDKNGNPTTTPVGSFKDEKGNPYSLTPDQANQMIVAYGPGAVKVKGSIAGTDIDAPLTNLTKAINLYKTLPPDPTDQINKLETDRQAAALKFAQGTGAPAGRVDIFKDGKKFTVPANQVDAALQQGYSKAP